MQYVAIQELDEDFSRSTAHALGYLMSIAALPLLSSTLPLQRGLMLAALLFVVVVLMRQFMVMSVRSALTRGRAKAVIQWVDRAAVFIGLASVCTAFAFDSRGQTDGWRYCLAAWALAAVGCSVHGLSKASKTWYSSTFVSSFFERHDSPASKTPKV